MGRANLEGLGGSRELKSSWAEPVRRGFEFAVVLLTTQTVYLLWSAKQLPTYTRVVYLTLFSLFCFPGLETGPLA